MSKEYCLPLAAEPFDKVVLQSLTLALYFIPAVLLATLPHTPLRLPVFFVCILFALWQQLKLSRQPAITRVLLNRQGEWHLFFSQTDAPEFDSSDHLNSSFPASLCGSFLAGPLLYLRFHSSSGQVFLLLNKNRMDSLHFHCLSHHLGLRT